MQIYAQLLAKKDKQTPSTMTKLTYKRRALLSSTQEDVGVHRLETTFGSGVGTPANKVINWLQPTEIKSMTPRTKTVERLGKNMQRLLSRSQ